MGAEPAEVRLAHSLVLEVVDHALLVVQVAVHAHQLICTHANTNTNTHMVSTAVYTVRQTALLTAVPAYIFLSYSSIAVKSTHMYICTYHIMWYVGASSAWVVVVTKQGKEVVNTYYTWVLLFPSLFLHLPSEYIYMVYYR